MRLVLLAVFAIANAQTFIWTSTKMWQGSSCTGTPTYFSASLQQSCSSHACLCDSNKCLMYDCPSAAPSIPDGMLGYTQYSTPSCVPGQEQNMEAFNGCRTTGGLVAFASCDGKPPSLPAGSLTITEYRGSVSTCTLGASNSTTLYQLGCTTKPGPVARGFYSNCPQQTTTGGSTSTVVTTTSPTTTAAAASTTTTPASGSAISRSFGLLMAAILLFLPNN